MSKDLIGVWPLKPAYKSIGLALCVAILISIGRPLHGAVTPNPDSLSVTIYQTSLLMRDGSYADACAAAQQLVHDSGAAPEALDLRGALALHINAVDQATSDFTAARYGSGSGDPLPWYGLALCALMRHDLAAATDMLSHAHDLAAGDPATSKKIIVAQAIVDAAKGDVTDAASLTAGLDDPVAKELHAFTLCLTNHADGVNELAAFVDDYGNASSIPRVSEEYGMRLMANLGDNSPIVEPSVTEFSLQQMDQHRLTSEIQAVGQDHRRTVQGTVVLQPDGSNRPFAAPSDNNAVITYSLDDKLLAIVSSAPYSFQWNTRTVTNGIHQIAIQARSAGGINLGDVSQTVIVCNTDNPDDEVADVTPEDAKAVLWNVVSIKPALKVALYALARAYSRSGQRDQAGEALIRSAAIDSDYRSSVASVARFFAGGQLDVSDDPAASKSGVALHETEFWRGSPTLKEVALTFDDGPNQPTTPPLLDAIERAHIIGTFFVVGTRAAANPDIIKRMAADGCEVEDHSYTHPNMAQSVPEHIVEEILRNAVIVHSLTNRWPKFFRCPGGDSNPWVMRMTAACGMIGAFWTVDAFNAEQSGSPDVLAQYVVKHIHPGAIVLMHNGAPATTGGVEKLAAELRAKGYKLVTMEQLARDSGLPI
jgi:peptidoglycan/xylan/chitin deacetylase (PgdA/CDA1 family)/tetratricopeptide (TPR) repeat protein